MKQKEVSQTLVPKKTFWVRLREEKYLQIMALLGILWMLIFNYIPMYGILIAFKKNYYITTPLFSKKFWETAWAANHGFQHFLAFFKDEEFLNVMANTLGISVLKLVFNFTLPIIFALILNEVKNLKFKKTIQTITYMPHFLSWVVLGGILTTWLGEGGLFNELLIKMGILKEGVSFLAFPKYFWAITVISDLWKELGWSAIIYLAAISGIDQEMYEAAKVDGASRWKQIWTITLPSIAPTVTIMFILAVGNLLNSNFDQILVLNNPLNAPRSNVLDIYVYQTAMRGMRYSYASAIGLFKSVIAFFLLFVTNQITKKMNDTALF
ncbi:MAG: ABC transporter permease subunit [Treponema sp.]|nr:ABC transporter permease subunit [Treponema sp.]